MGPNWCFRPFKRPISTYVRLCTSTSCSRVGPPCIQVFHHVWNVKLSNFTSNGCSKATAKNWRNLKSVSKIHPVAIWCSSVVLAGRRHEGQGIFLDVQRRVHGERHSRIRQTRQSFFLNFVDSFIFFLLFFFFR